MTMPLRFIASANRPAVALLVARRTAGLRAGAPFSSAASASAHDGGDDGNGSNNDVMQSTAATVGSLQSTTRSKQQARRRTRRRTLQSADGEAVPSLADFMHRAKVLKQYRSFVRLAQFVDGKDSSHGGDAVAGECRAALEEVRLSFKMGMKKDVDDLSKSMAYSEGERRLRELEAMVGYSARNKQSSEAQASNAMSPESYDSDSWINIQDDDDPRGRVGVQWPWEQGKTE